jgi:hypothetical protein
VILHRPEPGTGAPPARAGEWPLNLFVAVVAVVGASVVLGALLELPMVAHPAHGALFAVLALVAGRFALKIPGLNARFSVADTFFVTSGLLFGPAMAT